MDLFNAVLQCGPSGNIIVWKCQYFRAFLVILPYMVILSKVLYKTYLCSDSYLEVVVGLIKCLEGCSNGNRNNVKC